MGVLVRPDRDRAEQELAGHLEMADDRPAAFAVDQNQLAAPPYPPDGVPAERPQVVRRSIPQEMRRPDSDSLDDEAQDPSPQPAHDRLDFGQLRHVFNYT